MGDNLLDHDDIDFALEAPQWLDLGEDSLG
jgi:hypothetical protein